MTIMQVESFVAGRWIAPGDGARQIESAVTGQVIGQAGGAPIDSAAMLAHARDVGGPALRALTFHQRAQMLKDIAKMLNDHRDALYALSDHTGATAKDHLIDIDGGIGTMFVFSSKGRRELPDGQVFLDGPVEQLSRNGTFLGRHICTPLQGVAVHINAFNFPVWGMLEKLAPTLLAGVPAIVKPATATCYVAEACARLILDSGILPEGALQLVSGDLGDVLDHLGGQDVVSFTGSAATAQKLRGGRAFTERGARFVAEQDSLNAAILGPDVGPDSPEFALFIKEAAREMTVKAGQKCTAIRRVLVPEAQVQAVIAALSEKLAKVVPGDPSQDGVTMGPLVSYAQRRDVVEKLALLEEDATRVFGDISDAALSPILLHCADPDSAAHIHDVECFGPAATVMGYRDLPHAIALANRGQGSLVASLFTHDPTVAREVALGSAAYHGRIYINDRDSADESTGHGSPLPHMVHGGPGRAGGGEELGGIRAVMHYMQRTAIQGSPEMLAAIGGSWVPGATEVQGPAHPFTRRFGELQIGETLNSDAREITSDDIEHFAHFTGDTFYAHMDDAAAARNPFFPGRVAHGYLLLSFAAGLFVEPNEGPVLANYGLEGLRFMKPVVPGDAIRVRLVVAEKTRRNDTYGEVRWHVTLTNQDNESVAEYTLLTMNAA